MPRLRSLIVTAAFTAAAAILYSGANRAYVENYNRDEADSRAAQQEIKAMLPHMIALRTRFETATDDTRYLWRDTNRTIEDAHNMMTIPQRPDPERDCGLLYRMNEINIFTGTQYPLSAQLGRTLNMCRNHLTYFRGH